MVGQLSVEAAHDEANDGLGDQTDDLRRALSDCHLRISKSTDHRILGSEVVNNECTTNGTGDIEQAAQRRGENLLIRGGCVCSHLMTTAQPKTTVRESLPPVTL